MPYLPIEHYGLIGNLRTAALVGINGSIDWLCLPKFDSPSVFGAILDDEKGGRFQITPRGKDLRHKQFYWPDTNILITRFLHEDGIGELEDYMPVGENGCVNRAQLIRRVRVVRGKMPFHLECRPAFDYARGKHRTTVHADGALFESDDLLLGMSASLPLRQIPGGITADFTLDEGESATFVLRILDREQTAQHCLGVDEAERLVPRDG